MIRAVLKATLLPAMLRLGASETLMRLAARMAAVLRPLGLARLVYFSINLYNYHFPHAPDAMYETETRFFRDIAPELQRDGEAFRGAPRAYGTLIDARQRRFAILMENLSPGHVFPNAMQDMALGRLRGLLQVLAALHGRFWESPRFAADLAWVPTVRAGGMHTVFHTLGFGLIDDHVRHNVFEQQVLAPLQRTVSQLWQGLCTAEEHVLAATPVTLCHGDAHVQNCFLSADGQPSRAGFLDWQLMLRASWARDVSYLVATALSTEQRRRHEDELLAFYLDQLAQHTGAQHAASLPSLTRARELYSMAMAWGLVIGWLICPPNNYGQHIWTANVARLVAACVDLDTFPRLERLRAQQR